ncbi:ferritin-like domain-containing protein [Allosphingosinicella vermicomposti]|uniref:ferritin-like domain-containing protein n=1 Tax=Allosphingosinicella vermicomposti TaxID=614671 RepID=UPI001FE11EDD|nr:ferritin-like domain-containing protein [Allosphingosinicella vermicomposti]
MGSLMTGEMTVAAAARLVLETTEPREKVKAARAVARAWRQGRLLHRFDVAMPARPGRPAKPDLLPPARMPKRGKGGSERGRIAMLHALAHIEFGAIDLAFDLAGRFGEQFPRAFVDDWFGVGADEAMHFALLDRRLRALGSSYGALPAHDGLWESAEKTAHDVLARLAVVPMALEARGLDVTPATIDRFRSAGDKRSATIIHRIYCDEIRHVAAGTRWFKYACDSAGFEPKSRWKWLIETYFRGMIKPPFNDSARDQAGLSRDFYEGVAAREQV